MPDRSRSGRSSVDSSLEGEDDETDEDDMEKRIPQGIFADLPGTGGFLAGLAKRVQTGGIVPSQRFLIEKMIAPVPPAYGGQVIELGAAPALLRCAWRRGVRTHASSPVT